MYKVGDKVYYEEYDLITRIREISNGQAMVIGLFHWVPFDKLKLYGEKQQGEVSIRYIHGANEGEV